MSTSLERKWFEAVASVETCVLCQRWGVQVAHSNEDRGMGQKSPPWMTAAICPLCHHEIDNGNTLAKDIRVALMRLAINRTHAKLIEAGRLVLT